MKKILSNSFTEKIAALIKHSQTTILNSFNHTMVCTYFEIGRMIMEEEQNGNDRAAYGKYLLKELSLKLTQDFGNGFSETNLKQMRQFYVTYQIRQTVSDEFKNNQNSIPQTVPAELRNNQPVEKQFKLSWSHYLKLMRIIDPLERNFYEIEAHQNNWSLRELSRQFDTALYTRLALGKDKTQLLKLATKGQIIETPQDLIKDPYILDFLGIEENTKYSESELEQKLIDKLENFILELGKGFTFVARQNRITFDEKHFKIDLVFYNRFLKCFVLIDLKIGELKHQDIGQMQMYVNYYDREIKLDDENNTIGILLCQDKSDAVVKYTLPQDNTQIFASQYLTVLPSKEDFQKLLRQYNARE